MANMWVDPETNQRLDELAESTGRTKIETIRRLLENNLDLLPPFQQAVLFHYAKEHALDSNLEAASAIIAEWEQMKRQGSGDSGRGSGRGESQTRPSPARPIILRPTEIDAALQET